MGGSRAYIAEGTARLPPIAKAGMAEASPEKPDHTAISVAGPPSAATRKDASTAKPGEGEIQTIDVAASAEGKKFLANGQEPRGGLKQYRDLLNKLTDAEILELKGAFNRFDRDGSGFLDMKELGDVLKSLGSELTDEEFSDFARMVDQDKDNKIDQQEFMIMMAIKLAYPFAEDEIARAFEVFDEDHNGLDLTELHKEMVRSLENDDLHRELSEQFYEEAKKFADEFGKINYRSFASHLMSAKSIPDGGGTGIQ